MDWKRITGTNSWHGRGEVNALEPDTTYVVSMPGAGRAGTATARTLPEGLTSSIQDPGLCILLGSCFSYETGKGLRLAGTVQSLPRECFPHIKVLCGDQVYLDLPVSENLPEDLTPLREKLLRKYRRNWNHGCEAAAAKGDGFGQFLRLGGNVMVTDDHEFWNNYPFRQAQLPITWRSGPRSNFAKACREMFASFQSAHDVSGLQHVVVGAHDVEGRSIEICALDGRVHRAAEQAHAPAELAFVTNWLRSLQRPGVLVLSQPLFDEPAGAIAAKFKDAQLANFDDYGNLVSALAEARHDVLILSGDIHRPRYAVTERRFARIHEVTASPLSLIGEGTHSTSNAHGCFPDPAVPGVERSDVETQLSGLKCNNFATLNFTAAGSRINVRLRFWKIPDRPTPLTSPAAKYDFVLS